MHSNFVLATQDIIHYMCEGGGGWGVGLGLQRLLKLSKFALQFDLAT